MSGSPRTAADPRRDWVIEAVYKAIGQYEEAKRLARGLRAARNGKGPTIKRGTGRGALAVHVTDAVIAALHQWDDDAEKPLAIAPESRLHQTHVCRDCGAEITLPYTRADDILDVTVAQVDPRIIAGVNLDAD